MPSTKMSAPCATTSVTASVPLKAPLPCVVPAIGSVSKGAAAAGLTVRLPKGASARRVIASASAVRFGRVMGSSLDSSRVVTSRSVARGRRDSITASPTRHDMRSKRYASARHLRSVVWREDRAVGLARFCSVGPVKWNKFARAIKVGGPGLLSGGPRYGPPRPPALGASRRAGAPLDYARSTTRGGARLRGAPRCGWDRACRCLRHAGDGGCACGARAGRRTGPRSSSRRSSA